MRKLCPAPPVNEVRLLREGETANPELEYPDLTAGVLARITAERGVDFATALLYSRIRRSREHGPFIRRIDALEPDPQRLPQLPGTLLLVPAGFYREHPETGGDGAFLREIAAEHGLPSQVVPVESGGSVIQNAEVVRRTLQEYGEGEVILVSLSKGGAEARLALAEGGRSARAVRAWVQICGLVRGSP